MPWGPDIVATSPPCFGDPQYAGGYAANCPMECRFVLTLIPTPRRPFRAKLVRLGQGLEPTLKVGAKGARRNHIIMFSDQPSRDSAPIACWGALVWICRCLFIFGNLFFLMGTFEAGDSQVFPEGPSSQLGSEGRKMTPPYFDPPCNPPPPPRATPQSHESPHMSTLHRPTYSHGKHRILFCWGAYSCTIAQGG